MVLKLKNGTVLSKRGDQLTMSHFDNFDNEFLKKFIDVFFYLWIDVHSNFSQFHYRLIVHKKSLNWNRYKLHKNLVIFDGLSNDNEIL
jgi:hypothetical protein